jgi:hypothetical protein
MAAPVAGIFVLLTVPVTRWRAVFLAFFVLLAAVLAIAWFAPFGRIRIVDTAWLGVIERRSWFLLVSHWRHSDWLRAVVPIASLVAAAGILKGTPAGGLAKATIAVCLAGLATSYVAGDLMPVAIVMQSQPWRTLWVTTLVAVVLLPAMCQSAWSGSLLERASSLVLISAWLDVSSDAAAPLAVLSVALAYWPRTHDPRVVKLLTKGAWAILVVSAVFGLVGALDAAVNLPTLGPIMAGRLELLRNVARYVAPTLACLATTWYLCTLRPSAVGVGIAAAFTLMLGAAVMPAAAGQFWARTYTGPQYDEFASWRGRIPEGVNVMWIGNPTATWLLLERPSYVSVHQLAGVVFSRDMALEGADRAARVSAIQDPSRTFGESPRTDLPGRPLTLQSLHDVCRDSGVGFVVSGKSLSTKIATGHWPDRSRDVFLYDCNSQQTPSISRP